MIENDFPVPPVTNHQPGTVGRFLEVAKSQIGYIEGPKDNQTKYGAYTKMNFQPHIVSEAASQAGRKACAVSVSNS